MPNWLIKAGIQKLMSLYSEPQRINSLFQRYMTHSYLLDKSTFDFKRDICIQHIERNRKFRSETLQNSVALEIGTGWHPVTAVGFYIAGAKRIITIDITPLVSSTHIRRVLEYYSLGDPVTRGMPGFDEGRLYKIQALLEKYTEMTVEEIFAELNIDYLIVDAHNTDIEDNFVDVIFSNHTFEHIPGDVLYGILKEFRRIIKPTGVMSHFIDMRDHYAKFDSSINFYNFLRYSDDIWGVIGNNKLQYQNRLRLPDYLQLYQESGFEICELANQTGTLEELRSVPIAKKFQCYKDEPLLVYSTWVTSRPVEAHALTHPRGNAGQNSA